MTIDNINPTVSLSASAMLVNLTCGQWSDTKTDKTSTAELLATKKAAKGAARVSTRLLPNESAYARIGKIYAAARQYHYRMTLPWADSGMRLLPNKLYFEYFEGMKDFNNQIQIAIDDFLFAYPAMIARARQDYVGRGELFTESDYPDADTIRAQYRFSTDPSPVPQVSDFRLDIEAEQLTQVKAAFNAAFETSIQTAMRDAWERLHDCLAHLSERLTPAEGEDGKAKIFRDSLVHNARELTLLLDSFNVTGDAKLSEATARLRKMFEGIYPDAIRQNDYLRADIKKQADAMLAELDW